MLDAGRFSYRLSACLPVCLCRVSVLYMRVGWSIIICQEVKNFYFIDYFGAIHAMHTDIFVVSD